MRGKTVVRAALPVVLCLAAVLWLVWGFLTWPVAGKAILTLVVLLVAGILARRRYRQHRPVQLADEAGIFPPESHTGPVVLVCGDVDDNMFAAGHTRGTAQGWYLRILSQAPAGVPLPAAARAQLEMHLKQLTARYAEIKQNASK